MEYSRGEIYRLLCYNGFNNADGTVNIIFSGDEFMLRYKSATNLISLIILFSIVVPALMLAASCTAVGGSVGGSVGGRAEGKEGGKVGGREGSMAVKQDKTDGNGTFSEDVQSINKEPVSGEAGSMKSTDKEIDKNDTLKGEVICIDPGHQAEANYEKEPVAPSSNVLKDKVSSGTAGVATGVPEYKLNLEVSLKLKAALEKRGAKIVITRMKNNVNISNIDRARIANDSNADLAVRIHADGSDNRETRGISVLFPGEKYLHNKDLLKKSSLAAEKVLEALILVTGAEPRGIAKRDDITGFNWSTVPVILVEMGFMSNESEDRLLNSPDYQDKIVRGIVRGIVEYFKAKK